MSNWLIYAILSAVFAALTAIFSKAGLKEVNSDLATAIRTAIVLLITWAFVFFKGNTGGIGQFSRNNWIFLVLSAFATGFSWLFYFKALQIGKVSDVTVIDKGSIVFTLLLSFIFLKEPMTPKLLIGGGLVLAGMLVMVWK